MAGMQFISKYNEGFLFFVMLVIFIINMHDLFP